MSGGDKCEGRQTRSAQNKVQDDEEMEENAARTEAKVLAANALMGHEGIPGLAKLIEELGQEIKNGFSSFKEEVKADIKNEFDAFKAEINTRFDDNYKELQDQKRIFGVPEGVEGASVSRFVEEMLRRELELPAETRLLIQRAHRALAEKPEHGAAPRSIIVNFHQFDTKEMILRKAWQKRLKIDGKPLFFDHDYAYDVVQKRKAYGGIKRVLKDSGVKFQTPMTKIKIHWTDGTKTYGNPHDAAEEMRRRGLDVTTKITEQKDDAMARRIQQACSWQRAQASEERSRSTSQRAREKLQEFRR
ncbi:hypothetical protein WMY93_010405 [Mugilogobius chulae]|uniref:L1 transposable element RRM domain-containing protein n=1 Tax=Mugilogobius chulae TaxID=88201 RepID=A0AAW0PIP9_9GOBI